MTNNELVRSISIARKAENQEEGLYRALRLGNDHMTVVRSKDGMAVLTWEDGHLVIIYQDNCVLKYARNWASISEVPVM